MSKSKFNYQFSYFRFPYRGFPKNQNIKFWKIAFIQFISRPLFFNRFGSTMAKMKNMMSSQITIQPDFSILPQGRGEFPENMCTTDNWVCGEFPGPWGKIQNSGWIVICEIILFFTYDTQNPIWTQFTTTKGTPNATYLNQRYPMWM